jgi:hypothetical protein
MYKEWRDTIGGIGGMRVDMRSRGRRVNVRGAEE